MPLKWLLLLLLLEKLCIIHRRRGATKTSNTLSVLLCTLNLSTQQDCSDKGLPLPLLLLKTQGPNVIWKHKPKYTPLNNQTTGQKKKTAKVLKKVYRKAHKNKLPLPVPLIHCTIEGKVATRYKSLFAEFEIVFIQWIKIQFRVIICSWKDFFLLTVNKSALTGGNSCTLVQTVCALKHESFLYNKYTVTWLIFQRVDVPTCSISRENDTQKANADRSYTIDLEKRKNSKHQTKRSSLLWIVE